MTSATSTTTTTATTTQDPDVAAMAAALQAYLTDLEAELTRLVAERARLERAVVGRTILRRLKVLGCSGEEDVNLTRVEARLSSVQGILARAQEAVTLLAPRT